MEKPREKFGNHFAAKAVTFILCILLIASSLWFLANGWIQINKPGAPVVNANYLEFLEGKDYQESDALQKMSVTDLTGLLYGFESAKKIASIETTLADLEKEINSSSEINKIAIKDILVQYFGQLDQFEYQNSDLYYIVDGAYYAWMNGSSGYSYQLTGLDREAVFDLRLIGDNVIPIWPGRNTINGEIIVDEGYPPLISTDSKSMAIEFFTTYPEQLLYILDEWKIINEEQMNWSMTWLNDYGMNFYATDGNTVFTNINDLKGKTNFNDSDFDQNQAYFGVRNGVAVAFTESLSVVRRDWVDGHGPNYGGPNLEWRELSCFISYPASYFDAHSAAYNAEANIFRSNFIPFIVFALAAIVLMILLIVWTGRVCANGERRLYLLDKFFMEGQVIIIGICVFIAIFSIDEYIIASSMPLYYYWPGGSGGDIISGGSLLLIGLLIALSIITLWCLLSLVRNLKANLFIRRSLIGLICLAIGRGVYNLCKAIQKGYEEKNPLTKTIILVVVFWLLTIIFGAITVAGGFIGLILLIAVLVAAIYYTVQWVNRYGRLRKGVEEVSSGNVNYRIDVPEGSNAEFDRLSKQVNEISKAIERAVENELKNQRLKTDLITNVSHDLKTPLTSIITYTDLLKTEGLKSKNAPDYLDILEEKGQRLKKLTDDLFEAAKASSGDISASMGRVDLLSLIRQEIAETELSFAKNDLEVIVDAPDEHYYINADGNLMWRVMENIFRNTGKYASPGSRVYIDLSREERVSGAERIVFTMKNISASKLNIPADELMERFQRGDENRTTEGSGLGLAIARDLVRLQKGRFDIVIDGDLFKAVIEMEPYEE